MAVTRRPGIRIKRTKEKPIRHYDLETDVAREWEEFHWTGDHLSIIRNDTSDLQIMFDVKGSKLDEIPIPKIAFGATQVTIEYGSEHPMEKRVKFQKVFLKHSAVADGHIIVIVGGAASFYSITAGGAVIIAGYPYGDYAEVNFTAVQQSYVRGTNANVAVLNSWPTLEPVKRTRMWCNQDCYVRFDNAAAVLELVDAGREHTFMGEWTTLYVVRVANNGRLRIWMEG